METNDKDKKVPMKSYISRIIIYNRAPFDKLDLSFEENGISILTGINGQGKTTILSYIVDSWFELIRNHFKNEFKGREGAYYRISSPLFIINNGGPSIVYIRYNVGNDFIDHMDYLGEITKDEYDNIVPITDKIPYARIHISSDGTYQEKIISENANGSIVKGGVSDNIITCFPSFRYELPYYLTDLYKHDYSFKKDFNITGFLKNPLLVVSGIDGIANWLMDLVLDMKQYDGQESNKETVLWKNVNDILTAELSSKLCGKQVRFGLGRRDLGASRISIVNRTGTPEDVYPSIFGMSSGELAILAMFVEILRQADNLHTNIKLEDIQGIVLIDEIDKHLHIKLQKEVIPAMLDLFPNVQFIVSTHSPFLTMGLAENAKTLERSKIIDLDQGGMVTEPKGIEIYDDVYKMMIGENNNFKELYDDLLTQIKTSTKPLVITEGKTDAKHIKNAIKRLGIKDVNVEFYEIGDQNWGDSELKSMLEYLAKIDNQRKIIGIFDRDSETYVQFASGGTQTYRLLRPGSNVYAFSIPLVNETEYGSKISIEHYYHKKDLLKFNSNNRRIFLGGEFYDSGNSIDGAFQAKVKKDKIEKNGVVDEKVYCSTDLKHEHSIAMTKNDFAKLVCGDTDYAADFDFSNFNHIIDIIRDISQI